MRGGLCANAIANGVGSDIAIAFERFHPESDFLFKGIELLHARELFLLQ